MVDREGGEMDVDMYKEMKKSERNLEDCVLVIYAKIKRKENLKEKLTSSG